MDTYVIVSEKIWNKTLLEKLKGKIKANWILIDNKESFSFENILKIAPSKVFIPHWSYYIPKEIYSQFECIVFHETDLPFGRGGSPVQNLIERGFEITKISAIKVEKELDAGDIYLKRDLTLLGTAEEIFIRVNKIIEEMIQEIIQKRLTAKPQIGEPTIFKRRTPKQSEISNLDSLYEIFDYIRMLDGEGYPKAFIENEHFKFEFSRASLKANQTIIADVRIIKK